MLEIFEYNRKSATFYANRWAYRRNPEFFDFQGLGGDCTNFVSQCLLAGTGVMNYTPDFGWYYISSDDRAPAWSGVQYLYNFLTSNQAEGPFASEVPINSIQAGDVIQLGDENYEFYHTMIVTSTGAQPNAQNTLVAAHSYDVNCRPLDTYNIINIRFLHIDGYRKQTEESNNVSSKQPSNNQPSPILQNPINTRSSAQAQDLSFE